MAVLYRKYRPQTFADVVDQKFIIQTLKNQVSSGQLSHAYLFTGSRGVGKTSVARILAKAVNCLERAKGQGLRAKEGDACGICEVCKQIEAGNFLDLVEIDAASNTGVDNIRELIEHVKFSPAVGKYKVFIIDEVHMLSKGAFNALLKTLEEPPAHAIFILATTEIAKVPATIISRTQRFDFKRLGGEEIKKHLDEILKKENLKLTEGATELVAQNSDGSVRDSLSLLDKIITLGENASLEDCRQLLGITDLAWSEKLLETILSGEHEGLPQLFGDLQERGVDLALFNRDFLEYLRKALVLQATGSAVEIALDVEHSNRLKGMLAKAGGLGEIIFIVRLFLKSYKDLSESPDPLIPILIASLEAASRHGKKTTASVSILKEPKTAEPQALPPVLKSETKEEALPVELDLATLEEVKEVWPKIISYIKTVNTPLANLMRGCELVSVEQGTVVLGVKFLFDKQSLEQQKNRQLIYEAIKKQSGKSLGFKATVKKTDSPQQVGVANTLTDALQIFGGEVVE